MASEYLKYINNGRDGYVVYIHDSMELKFGYGLGSGNCIGIIYILTIDSGVTKQEQQLAKDKKKR